MEEFVGGLWHRFITRAADRSYPEAAVRLQEVERTAAVVFRALGGDPGLKLAAAADTRHGARRTWLQRVAGSGEKTPFASRDDETLSLPEQLACLPTRSLNRDLYFWLVASAAALGDTAMAGSDGQTSADAWLRRNQAATLATLARFPGLESRYRSLVDATLALRPDPARLPADEAAQERAIRMALHTPGSATGLPPARRSAQPVLLWLYPSISALSAALASGTEPQEPNSGAGADPAKPGAGRKRHKAERTDLPERESPIILPFRAESLLTWAEYVRVNRATDDDPESDPGRAAADMDHLTLTRGGDNPASRVRFDLDLPSAAADDLPIGPGILVPEWDFRRRQLRPDYCRIQPMTARDAPPCAIPDPLRTTARRLRAQFSALQPGRRWLKNQPDGSELDVDACVRNVADRKAGLSGLDSGAYLAQVRQERDMACLVLADLSLSTDSWISNEQRVVDVIRDSLMLFAEALAATGDRFGLYGFSSLKRGHVRFHAIKDFDQRYDDAARGRIVGIKPGYYTRMGAAVRFATKILSEQANKLRLLLVLTDGKPNDMDHYEGRYAIEDTRMALIEARDQGLRPFCVTIDREAESYLPHLFGPAGFTVVRRPEELPRRLPQLYAQLTQA